MNMLSAPWVGWGGVGELCTQRGNDANQKFWIKTLKETKLGVARAFLTPQRYHIWNIKYILCFSLHATLKKFQETTLWEIKRWDFRRFAVSFNGWQMYKAKNTPFNTKARGINMIKPLTTTGTLAGSPCCMLQQIASNCCLPSHVCSTLWTNSYAPSISWKPWVFLNCLQNKNQCNLIAKIIEMLSS